AAYGDDCSTPNGEPGRCLPAASCRDIEQRIAQPEHANYLQRAACGEYNQVRHYCCSLRQVQHNSRVMSVLASAGFNCGNLLNQRVAHGYEVQLSSRPWMALLRYQSFGESRFLCGGTLIHNRYILTAAHCIYGLEDELYEVRLGEHRISTQKDCRQQGRKEKCAPPVRDVAIEKMLLHEHYDARRITNDIALLRLNVSVNFEKHIKPICLPISDELKRQAETHADYFVTGWGTTENGSASDVLLQANVPLQPRSTCANTFRREVLPTQLCVGGGDLQDSCKGDSGGPLQASALYLSEYKLRMVEFGIVSLGVTSCGRVSLPGLYTNVAEYVQWITDTMASNGL
ncbi:hypothetical protein KR222_004893, partial [Zaprionus bogoriensis]